MLCIKCKKEIPEYSIFCPLCGKKQIAEKKKALKRANGMGTVYKLQGRRRRPWVAAKNKVVIGYYEQKTDALTALERLSGRSLTDRYNMTFKEVYNSWSDEHFKTVQSKTVSAYKRAFEIFLSLHTKKFRDLRTSDFQAVIDNHLSKSYASLIQYKTLLTQMSSWAIREEICSTDYSRFIHLPRNEKKEKEIFTKEEIEKLIEDDTEAAKIVLLLISTGMRINELFSLRISDCHEDYVIGGEKTAAGKDRIIPLIPGGKRYLDYFANQANGDFLLSGYVGNRTANGFRNRDYYPLLKRLGIRRLTPHSTRHTYASWAVDGNMNAAHLKKILGHKDIQTTLNTYYHVKPEQLIKAVEGADAANMLLTNQEKQKREKP